MKQTALASLIFVQAAEFQTCQTTEHLKVKQYFPLHKESVCLHRQSIISSGRNESLACAERDGERVMRANILHFILGWSLCQF